MNKKLIEIDKNVWDSVWDSNFETVKQPLYTNALQNMHESVRISLSESTRYGLEEFLMQSVWFHTRAVVGRVVLMQSVWFHTRAVVGRVVSVLNSKKDGE
jgi:hypothetical protein